MCDKSHTCCVHTPLTSSPCSRNAGAQEILQGWNLHFDPKPASFDARGLPPEKLYQAQKSVSVWVAEQHSTGCVDGLVNVFCDIVIDAHSQFVAECKHHLGWLVYIQHCTVVLPFPLMTQPAVLILAARLGLDKRDAWGSSDATCEPPGKSTLTTCLRWLCVYQHILQPLISVIASFLLVQ